MQQISFTNAKKLNSKEIRNCIRKETYSSHTAGLAIDKLQANIVILPKRFSKDFFKFCIQNSKACPLVGKTNVGDPIFRKLGDDVDIRHDVPSYNIYENGILKKTLKNIENYWNNDLVAFAIGCSFTFEHELIKQGLSIDHIKNNKIVPMYKTNIKNDKVGVFNSKMVVSLRVFKKTDKEKIINISKNFLSAHGEPVHIGEPSQIGIKNIFKPDWGNVPRKKNDYENYYFWACGVTPQNAVMQAKIPFCITHTPGHMLITDKLEKEVSNL